MYLCQQTGATVRAAVDKTSGCEHVPPAVGSPTCGISSNNNLGLGGTKKIYKCRAANTTKASTTVISFQSDTKVLQPLACFLIFSSAGRAMLHLLGLDQRTCCDVYWLTHCSRAAGPGGEDAIRSDSSQPQRLFSKRVTWTEAEHCLLACFSVPALLPVALWTNAWLSFCGDLDVQIAKNKLNHIWVKTFADTSAHSAPGSFHLLEEVLASPLISGLPLSHCLKNWRKLTAKKFMKGGALPIWSHVCLLELKECRRRGGGGTCTARNLNPD